MTRTAAAGRFAEERLAVAAANLIGLGSAFSFTALLLGRSVFGIALASLLPLTLLMTAVGILLLRVARAPDGVTGDERTGEARRIAAVIRDRSAGVPRDLDE